MYKTLKEKVTIFNLKQIEHKLVILQTQIVYTSKFDQKFFNIKMRGIENLKEVEVLLFVEDCIVNLYIK